MCSKTNRRYSKKANFRQNLQCLTHLTGKNYKQDIPTNVTHTYRSSEGASNGF